MNPWNPSDLKFNSDSFSGVARLLPLPDMALFPHVVQPLHIHENRYRDLLDDAMADDKLIALSRLKPGWEPTYEGRPPVEEIGCLGKVIAHHPLEEGGHNLLLLGVKRIRVQRELSPVLSYRQARVELLDDLAADENDSMTSHRADQLRDELISLFRDKLPACCQDTDQLEEFLTEHVPLGVLADLIAYAMPIADVAKHRLLATLDVSHRVKLLFAFLESLEPEDSEDEADPGFPPAFSLN